jgi:DNA-binding MurR/RpiR family transcriptional regulator
MKDDHSFESFESFESLLSERQPELSPQHQRAARYLLDNPDDVAVSSMREIAKRAGIPASTLLRLANSIGCASYLDLKEIFIRRLKRQSAFALRAEEMQARKRGGKASPIESLVDLQTEAVRGIVGRNAPDRIAAFAKRMLAVEQIYFFGARSSFGPAYQFFYLYRMFRSNGVLINDPGGARADMLRMMTQKDGFFLVSFEPYAVESVRAAQYAKKVGVKLFVITDSAVSPFGPLADHALIVPTATNSFFPSLVGVTAVIEILLAQQVIQLGKSAVRELSATEERLRDLDAYWSE